MSNRINSHDKGGRGEREAVAWWVKHHPDLLLDKPDRLLSEGRRLDEGDLWVLADATVQVKNFAKQYLGKALREAAYGASAQALNVQKKDSEKEFALGMVVNAGARLDRMRWFASVMVWPLPEKEHVTVSNSLAAARAVQAAGNDSDLTALVLRKDMEPYIVAALPAWVRAYRTATGRIAPA